MNRAGITTLLVVGSCLGLGCASPSARSTNRAGESDRTLMTAPDSPVQQGDSQVRRCEGKSIERVEEYWADESLRSYQEVIIDDEGNEIPHGLTAQFYANGQKKLEMGYNCGVRDGPRLTWYDNGNQWSQGEFVDGKDHGHWIVWYLDQSKSQEFTLVRGVWHGVHTMWSEDGVKVMQVEWVNGMRQGYLRVWDPEGNLIYADQYVDNVKQPTPQSRSEKAG